MDELLEHIRARARGANLHLDQHDPDYIVGTIMTWLGNNNQILTPTGLKSREELEHMEDELGWYHANYGGDRD